MKKVLEGVGVGSESPRRGNSRRDLYEITLVKDVCVAMKRIGNTYEGTQIVAISLLVEARAKLITVV